MTILSMPARGQSNRYFTFFCDSLEAIGLRVIGIRDARSRRFGFDVLHLHFPTHFLTETPSLQAVVWAVVLSCFFVVTKFLGKPIVYTVHNVQPFTQRRRWLVAPYVHLLHRLCDAFVFLNATSRADFWKTFPSARSRRSIKVGLGPYPATVRDSNERRRLRALLGDEAAFTIGILGNIKPYKNLEVVRDLPARLSSGRPVKVIVAGKAQRSYETEANAILRELPSDTLVRIDGVLSDDDLDQLIQAVDIVLLPYATGWNSSAAMLVLSNHARILASDLPVFSELAMEPGAPWVSCYERAAGATRESLLGTLDRLAEEHIDRADRTRLLAFLASSSFAVSATSLRDLYRELDRVGRR